MKEKRSGNAEAIEEEGIRTTNSEEEIEKCSDKIEMDISKAPSEYTISYTNSVRFFFNRIIFFCCYWRPVTLFVI